MADKWEVGDVALCIDDRLVSKIKRSWPLKQGETYTVMGVGPGSPRGVSPYGTGVSPCLDLLEVTNPQHEPGAGDFDARRFQKQPSLLKEDETEREKELHHG